MHSIPGLTHLTWYRGVASWAGLTYGPNIFNHYFCILSFEKNAELEFNFRAGYSPLIREGSLPFHRRGVINPKLYGSRPSSRFGVPEMYTPRRTSFLEMAILDPRPRSSTPSTRISGNYAPEIQHRGLTLLLNHLMAQLRQY
jgi:hypothetical protein